MNYDTEINKGGDSENPGNAQTGDDEQPNGGQSGSEQADARSLGETPEGRGLRNDPAENGATEDRSEQWGVASVWNAALDDQEERELEARDHLWASELGNAPIDVYLKMRATEPSNPPNARSKRKFEAGRVFEWIVALILKRAGILKGEEIYCKHQYDGLLEVTGRLDKLAGGNPDYDKAREELTDMPDLFQRGMDRIIEHFKTNYPDGIDERPLEIKSVSSFAMDAMERSEHPVTRHQLQLFHYLKSTGYPSGLLIYICRDDMRMMEFPVTNPMPSVEEKYYEAIKNLSYYHQNDVQPEKEQMVVFEWEFGKFSQNLNVAYSNYLSMLYGYETPREYSDEWSKLATKWNRVLTRVKNDDKMTQKNLDVINEIKEAGFDWEAIKKTLK